MMNHSLYTKDFVMNEVERNRMGYELNIRSESIPALKRINHVENKDYDFRLTDCLYTLSEVSDVQVENLLIVDGVPHLRNEVRTVSFRGKLVYAYQLIAQSVVSEVILDEEGYRELTNHYGNIPENDVDDYIALYMKKTFTLQASGDYILHLYDDTLFLIDTKELPQVD